MFSQPTLFLLILLLIGLIAKNQPLIIAVVFLLLIKWMGLGGKVFPYMQAKGIYWGVVIITIAVLVPIAAGEIGFVQLKEAVQSSYAWIALGSGIFVAVIASRGIELLQQDPHITTALVFGTILAVAVFKGIAVGPVIGAGIAYLAMKIVSYFNSFTG
ncbi:DUF441 domain-containing protein [Bacillus taeanensis]|uniref:UPF0756 membrane protein DS031_01700 n=1 Tax=Bacillus taeanensis TaxID=273032 RepID=A0A366XZX2_9BACI|nr:DUF441 domain-containing protein [Bacillus taeanensis]RBW71487.1 DUF441 domain-containing protein [Bacillus taeanensis]